MSDLLPCPFCGNEASAIEDTSHSTAYSVGCFHGKCALEPYVWDVSKTEAVAAWNRRSIPATDARAEALLKRAVTVVRQALVDAAFNYKHDKALSSAMFKAETHATNAILALITETKP